MLQFIADVIQIIHSDPSMKLWVDHIHFEEFRDGPAGWILSELYDNGVTAYEAAECIFNLECGILFHCEE